MEALNPQFKITVSSEHPECEEKESSQNQMENLQSSEQSQLTVSSEHPGCEVKESFQNQIENLQSSEQSQLTVSSEQPRCEEKDIFQNQMENLQSSEQSQLTVSSEHPRCEEKESFQNQMENLQSSEQSQLTVSSEQPRCEEKESSQNQMENLQTSEQSQLTMSSEHPRCEEKNIFQNQMENLQTSEQSHLTVSSEHPRFEENESSQNQIENLQSSEQSKLTVSSEHPRFEENESFQNQMENLQTSQKEVCESTAVNDSPCDDLFVVGGMSSSENIFFCLEGNQQFQIDVMAKRKVKINIKLTVEDLEMFPDEVADFPGEILQIDNDLIICDMRKFTKEMLACDFVKTEGTDETTSKFEQESVPKEQDFDPIELVADKSKRKKYTKMKKNTARLNSDINSKPDISSDSSNGNVKRKGAYKCGKCNKDFSYLKTFQKHMSSHGSKDVSLNKLSKKVKEERDNLETKDLLKNISGFSSRRTKAKNSDKTKDEFVESNFHDGSFVNDLKTESDLDHIEHTESNSADECADFDDYNSDSDMELERRKKTNLPIENKTDLKKSEKPKQNLNKNNTSEEVNAANSALYERSQDNTQEATQIIRSRKKSQPVIKMKKSNERVKPAEDGLYHCSVCEKKYTAAKSLRQHMHIHSGIQPYECEVCKKSFFWYSNLSYHVKTAHINDKPHKCPVCGYRCNRQSILTKHMLIHNTEREPLACKICGQKYFSPSALKNHLITHSGVKSHKCSFCERAFYIKQQLKDHEKIHAVVPEFVCDICGKQFYRFPQLKNHKEGVHVDEKHFVCKTCGNAYNSLKKLKQHHLVHQKPVVCELCGRSFAVRSNLKAHMTLHTGAKPYDCEFCGKKFRWLAGYTRHKSIHLDVKKFSCKECGKRFYVKREYTDHLNVHKGIRPYKCRLCTSAFTHYSGLRKHYRNVHSMGLADVKQLEKSESTVKEKESTDMSVDRNELETVALNQEMFMI